MNKEIRWRQRFSNFNKAFLKLQEAANLNESEISDLEQEGLIQRFEYTFELSWKLLKDYLESKAVIERFPRDVIKEAVAGGILEDGEVWMEMLEKRNLLAHTYNESNFKKSVNLIRSSYFHAIRKLWEKFNLLI